MTDTENTDTKGKDQQDAPAPRKNGAATRDDMARPAASDAPQETPAPVMRVLGQYVKDLSFENPHAPKSLASQANQPEINVAINVNARAIAGEDYEVELHLDAKASREQQVVFQAELLYAGVFRLQNLPPDNLHPVLLIECPRMIFPFARQILADMTRNGGFPPLMLDPIDFAGMYKKRLEEEKNAKSGTEPTA